MTTPPSPEPTQYRVTFFFGPEPLEGSPDQVRCVFNVKKRSWKGGVQICVDVDRAQLARARKQVGFPIWVAHMLGHVAPEERDIVQPRMDDLFAQALCASKLDLAMQAGLGQENQTIGANAFVKELDQAVSEQPGRLTDYVRAELDLEELPREGV